MSDDEIRNRSELADCLTGFGAMLTRDIKDRLNYKKERNKGFETVITRLQMQTYVIPVNYEYSKRKNGNEYGWGDTSIAG